jgi:hypothetical protein
MESEMLPIDQVFRTVQLLTSKGFVDNYHLGGGVVAWKAAGLPTCSQQQPAGEARRKLFGLF